MSVRGSTKSKAVIQTRGRRSQTKTRHCELTTCSGVSTYIFELLSDRRSHEQRQVGCRISATDWASLSLPSLRKTKVLSRESKVTIYVTLIQLTVLYGSGTMTLTQNAAQNVGSFDSTFFRRTLGPVQAKGIWETVPWRTVQNV